MWSGINSGEDRGPYDLLVSRVPSPTKESDLNSELPSSCFVLVLGHDFPSTLQAGAARSSISQNSSRVLTVTRPH
jgi:hypothetical protein